MALKRISDYTPIFGGLAGTEMLEVETADGLARRVMVQQVADLGSTSGGGAAADVAYDNATSGLAAEDVQAAIDELAGRSPGGSTQSIVIACSDEATALTAGAAKVTFRMPYAFALSGVRASLTTAQTGGSILTVDINEGGASILSTKLTIDNGERTSTTAATPAVISDAVLADDAEITIDLDQIGDGTAKGLKVYLIGEPA